MQTRFFKGINDCDKSGGIMMGFVSEILILFIKTAIAIIPIFRTAWIPTWESPRAVTRA